MRTPILSALSLAFITFAACGDDSTNMMTMDMAPMETPLNERLVGTWNSMGCEPAAMIMGYSLYAKRSYKFTTATDWEATVDLFGDQNCTSFLRLLRVDSKGTFKTGNDISAVQGAKEIDFSIAERGATPYVDMARMLLNMINCGGSNMWAVGTRKDISQNGCDPLVPSVSSCMKEFDLAQLTDASTLKLGTRPMTANGICTGRPTTAGLPLVKQ